MPIISGFVGLAAVLAAVLAWSLVLRRRVRTKTTELEAALQASAEREEQFRLLVEHQTDFVVKVDPQGRFLYVSPAYCRTFGRSEEELLGNTFMPMVHEEDQAATAIAMKSLFEPPHTAYVEQRAMTVDGWRWLAWNDAAILGPDGEIREIIGVGRDITERKAAEELLRQSEERFAKAFHSSPAPLVISDIETGRFIDVNARWVEMLGYSRDEQVGRTSKDVGIWSDPGQRDQAMDALRRDRFFKDIPIEFVTKEKGTRFALWSAEIVSLEGRDVLLSLIFDYTERWKAEEALRESERRYRSVIDNIQDVYYRTDAGGHLIMISPSGVRLLGYENESEMLGRHNEIFWYEPERRQTFIELLKTRGRVSDHEVTLKRKDGRPVLVATSSSLYFDAQGGLLGVEGIFRDITERKRAEEALRASEEKFSSLFRLLPDAITLSDPDSGLIVDVNDAYARLTGYDRDELVGGFSPDLGLFVHPEDRERMLSGVRRTGHADNFETEIRRRDGSVIPCSISCQFLTLAQRGFLLAVTRDLTDARRMQDMMIQSEKMISVGGIAAGIAHEINNPLGIIVQAAQNLELRTRPDFPRNVETAEAIGLDMALLEKYMRERKILTFVQDMRTAAQRAADIIRHMLDFSRRSESRRKICSLPDIIDRAVELAQSDYDLKKSYDFKKIAIVREYDDDPLQIDCTETEIEQVLLNLLRNAAQAMAQTDPPVAVPRIVIRTFNLPRGMRIEVEDSGPGMPQAVRRRIFEPFFTTKPPGLGTGLGLSVSYFIVTQGHGGSMWVESEPGKGTKFVIELPVGSPCHESGQD
jgi:PAS domain S-box-containing protein